MAYWRSSGDKQNIVTFPSVFCVEAPRSTLKLHHSTFENLINTQDASVLRGNLNRVEIMQISIDRINDHDVPLQSDGGAMRIEANIIDILNSFFTNISAYMGGCLSIRLSSSFSRLYI